MFVNLTTLIIPTRNRPKSINKLLFYFYNNKIKFKQLLIIDSSDENYKKYNLNLVKKLKIKIINTYPSASHQRNIGLKHVKKNTKFIMFLDDDVLFFKDSFKKMNLTINKFEKKKNVVGFAFNLINKKKENFFIKKLKENKLLNYLNLYSGYPGKVLKSGWHSKIENVENDTYVEWLFSGATIYKKNIIEKMRFNTSLGSYSYLEDLFFSHGVFKKGYKLIVSKNGKFKNPNFVDRSNFNFGIKEVINRYKFVKKFNLNKILFFINCLFRFLKSFLQIFKFKINYLMRSVGNIYGIICIFLNLYEKK
tara:strand:+ start:1646 stop:2566 length:921 start_codon:yes stop_codon:yes gene_type:complete